MAKLRSEFPQTPLNLTLREEIDRYDENLYEVLAPYVLDEEGSWEVMQEYIHDRHSELD